MALGVDEFDYLEDESNKQEAVIEALPQIKVKPKPIVEEVKERSAAGQPVLVGTVSIEKSEQLAQRFKKSGVAHDVLNAKQHEREARIIENAGEPGRVTIATNMAGRGVDIILGGKKPEATADASEFKAWEERHQAVLESGGLAVIGTERHESRRIDNQLRGRSGRQGDPGVSQFFVSTEDDLMRIFGGDRLKALMNRLGLPDNEPIQHGMISGSIEQAQRRVEGHNFDIRKHLVEYDDVMNQHRDAVYRKRRRILELNPDQEDWLHDEIRSLLHDEEDATFDAKVNEIGLIPFRQLERILYLRTVDTYWVEHLMTMQHLREGIGLKGYAQRDPLVEYKEAAFGLFQELKDEIENQVAEMLLKAEPAKVPAAPTIQAPQTLVLQGADEQLSGGGFKAAQQPEPVQIDETPTQVVAPIVQPKTETFSEPKKSDAGITVTVRSKGNTSTQESIAYNPYTNVGRNDPCPCGSGKKFKKCHGA